MGLFLMILIAIVCLLLIGVILIQNSKGGGLASGFSSANQIGGVRRTADFLEKATWTLVIALMVLSVAAPTVMGSKNTVQQQEESSFEEGLQEIPSQQQPQMPPSGMPLPDDSDGEQ